jgi:nucleoside-diphosphate-sugar epimerase
MYPNARIVIGGLDDIRALKHEVERADIIVNLAATVHAVGVLAIAEALAARALAARKDSPRSQAYWIQMSGGSVFIADEMKSQRFGFASEEVHDDLRDCVRTISNINSNPDRISEHIVLRQSSDVVKTALLMGPLIYGRGRGPWNQRTVQCTEVARNTLKLGYGFKLHDGKNAWSNVHVADFAKVVCLLIKAAIQGRNDGLWNQDGIYHPENGKMVYDLPHCTSIVIMLIFPRQEFGMLSTLVTKEARLQGYIPPYTDELRIISSEEANRLSGHADVLWGTNAIMTSTRTRENLNWRPRHHSLEDEISMMVREEARFLEIEKLKGQGCT